MKTLIMSMLALTFPFVSHIGTFNAQQKGDKSKNMAEMLKATQPGERHKQLEPLAGSWDVLVRFKYGPGPEREGKATSEARWILGGRFLQQEYQSESGQVTLQFIGYDNQRKKFFEMKMDNIDTGVLYTEGAMSEDGKVITNVGLRTDPITGEAKKLRIVITLTDRDHYTVEWFQPNNEGQEEKRVTMIHTRKQR